MLSKKGLLLPLNSVMLRPSLEYAYIDGVSLTYGAAGSRQHIWTFASALYETSPRYIEPWSCRCANTNITWPFQLPSFIGKRHWQSWTWREYCSSTVYSDDPLWDGEGCGPTSTCCQVNNPPWFCTALPQPTTDDIEMRICGSQRPTSKDVYVQYVDIHVM